MKAERIKETTGMNPAFVPRSYHRAKAAGEVYEIPPEITYPVGSIADGRGVLIQCVLPEPTMVPADAECHAAVREYLESPGLRRQFEKLQQMGAPEVFDTLPKGLQKYVRAVLDKWQDSPTAAIARGEKRLPDLKKTDRASRAGKKSAAK